MLCGKFLFDMCVSLPVAPYMTTSIQIYTLVKLTNVCNWSTSLWPGTRCPDTDVCVRIPKKDAANPKASPFGYACCPRSGYTLNPVAGSAWQVWSLLV
jgi:hypothetical protein